MESKKQAALEKTEKEAESLKKQEDAFLEQEKEAVRIEHNDQMQTKRLIDKMMLAPHSKQNGTICELLSNYKGIFLQKKNFTFLTTKPFV